MARKRNWPQEMLKELWVAMSSGPVTILRESGGVTHTYTVDAYHDHFHILHECNSTSFAMEMVEGLGILRRRNSESKP